MSVYFLTNYTVTDPDGYRLTFAKTVKQMSPEEVMAMQQGGANA